MTAPVAAGAAGAGAGAAGAGARAGAAGRSGGQAANVAGGVGLGDILRRRGSSAHPSGARRLLVAEFIVCMVVLAFSPLTGKAPGASAFMKRGSAIMGLFFILGLISTAGRGASRAAAGFGGLVTLVLLISDRSIFTVLAKRFGQGVGEEDSPSDGLVDAIDEVTGPGVDVGADVGDIGSGIGTDVGSGVGGITDDVAELIRRAVR